jgi:hypothetical protein
VGGRLCDIVVDDIPLFGGGHGVGLTTELVVVPCGGTGGEDGGSRGSGGGGPLG